MAERASHPRWLYGPFSDLTLGCGLGYGLLFAGFLVAGTRYPSVLPLVPLISLFTGTPHYGATLLRVYEQRHERRAYAFFGVWMTLVVWAVFYLGLYHATVGSLLLTLYLSWSPWHYSGQNYGIALMFLRRRGIEVTPRAKRALYLSFFLSFLLALLAMHGASSGADYGPVPPYRDGAFHLVRLRLPEPVWEAVFFGLGAGYLLAVGTAAASLLRRARPLDLLPSATLVATQALWFALPPLVRHGGWLGDELSEGAAYAFFWVATGHTVQYVWITTYYAVGRGSYARRAGYFARALFAGSFIWAVPALLYTWSVEGTRFGGVALGPDVGVLVAAAVNLHHFILDGAIWKLRDGRVARILIQRPPETPAPIEPQGRGWLAAGLLGAGSLATLAVLAAIGERELRLDPALARGDLARVHDSLERLAWIGQVGAEDYRRAGQAAARMQSDQEARHYFQRSLAAHPNPRTWLALGHFESARGREEAARSAFEAALALDPSDVDALFLLGSSWLQAGDPARALEFLERAEALVPDDPRLAASIGRARRRAGVEPAEPRPAAAERL